MIVLSMKEELYLRKKAGVAAMGPVVALRLSPTVFPMAPDNKSANGSLIKTMNSDIGGGWDCRHIFHFKSVTKLIL